MVAGGNIHKGIIAGKLKGAMPAQTPKGIPRTPDWLMKAFGKGLGDSMALQTSLQDQNPFCLVCLVFSWRISDD